MRTNQEARKIFDQEVDPKYMPHLSLLYGDFPSNRQEGGVFLVVN